MKHLIRKQQLIARMRKLARSGARYPLLKRTLHAPVETTDLYDHYQDRLNEMAVFFVNQPHANDNENTKYQNNVVNVQA